MRLDFSILIYPEDDLWIAHCLEMDLPAEGKSPDDALRNLMDVADLQITSAMEEGNLQSIFSPSPSELWRLYAFASDVKLKRLATKNKAVNRLAVRELVLA